MGELVELYKGKEPRVSTALLFEKLGYTGHRFLKRVISAHEKELLEYGLLPLERQKVAGTKGRPDESYLINEDQFILLVMLVKNSPESVELKVRIAKEFKTMRKMLSKLASTRSTEDWQNVRNDGKVVYLQKTDVIKQFVDYAIAQGSKSANMYYSNLAQMENKALFLIEQKYPNVREVLNIKQLMQVATADQIVEKALGDGMKQELHYKKIYVLAKDRVIQFSEILGKSLVIEMLETPRLNQDV